MTLRYQSRQQQRRHGLEGYMVLGAIAPAQAVQQAISSSGVSSGTIPSSTIALIQQSVSAGQLLDQQGAPAYIPGTADCKAASGVSSGASNDLKLVGTAGNLSLTAATTTGLVAAGPATLGISIAIAGIVGIFSTIFSHHAKAVQSEQDALCAAVPAANNYLNIIQESVISGQATPAQGIQALQSLSSDFDSAVSSIRKMSGGSCNAACVMTEMLRANIAYITSELQDLEAASAAAAASTATTPTTSIAPSSGPTTAAPVTSGSTMQIQNARSSTWNATPATTTTAAATTTPAAAAAAPPQTIPSWFWIAAAAFFGLLLVEG